MPHIIARLIPFCYSKISVIICAAWSAFLLTGDSRAIAYFYYHAQKKAHGG